MIRSGDTLFVKLRLHKNKVLLFVQLNFQKMFILERYCIECVNAFSLIQNDGAQTIPNL